MYTKGMNITLIKMIKKITALLVTAAFILLMVPSLQVSSFAAPDTTYSGTENEKIVYNFLMNDLELNDAAAAGILANLYSESSYNPNAEHTEADGSISYGLCQWNKSRFTALKDYCSDNGYDYTTLNGQLYFLKYELEGSESKAYEKVKNVSNTADGAYLAGYNWAAYFERCASVYYERRACLSRDSYWPIYGIASKVMTARGINYPITLSGGSHYSLYGSVESPNILTKAEVSIKDSSGNVMFSYNTSGKRYIDINQNADSKMLFNKLTDGSYYYCVYAEDSCGFVLDFTRKFTVGSEDTKTQTLSTQEAEHNHDNVFGYSWDKGTVIIEPTVEEDGLILYTCYCGVSKTESIPKLISSFIITYDANGGDEAPEAQGKAKDTDIILSSTIPVREGYVFLGWSENKSAEKAEYMAGDVYSKNADAVLYAVWSEEVISVKKITLSSVNTSLFEGESLKLEAQIFPDNAANKNVVWTSSDPDIASVDTEGNVTGIKAGTSVITVSAEDGKGSYASCYINVAGSDWSVGDVNGDGDVNSKDLARLMKYLAGIDINALFPDVNGDGNENVKDLARLMKIIAGVI